MLHSNTPIRIVYRQPGGARCGVIWPARVDALGLTIDTGLADYGQFSERLGVIAPAVDQVYAEAGRLIAVMAQETFEVGTYESDEEAIRDGEVALRRYCQPQGPQYEGDPPLGLRVFPERWEAAAWAAARNRTEEAGAAVANLRRGFGSA